MRVCMMNDHFYRSSGAAMAIRRIALAMPDIEYCVAACASDGRIEDLSWVPDERHAKFDLKSSSPIQTLKELLRFRRWFKQWGCDLVHCHHRRLSVLLQLAGIRVLYTGQLAFPYSTWFRWLHPRLMTAITPSVATNILETTGRSALACISNPVEFPETVPAIDIETVGKRAVCVARLEPIKGHKHLLAAWKILVDRGYTYELDLVGEGSLKPQLLEQIKRDGLQELIHFRGFTTDVSSIIRGSLFAILASQREGQGIVTLEAAANGRPSLLTAVPGSIDVIPHDHVLPNAVPFGDEEALADLIEQWFGQPQAVVEEGKHFFEFLKASSDPQKIAREYKKIYEQMLAGEV
jgi:glycosyltransferase involved in cell wall biosynthesis